ncbi:MAG: hypothetical protein NUW14_00855 [Deltaproteobacteria bacterium]|nr:hypothetical protein [Deltaproteobacteria bacterium]
MAGMRSRHRLHLLKLVVPLGGIALWMCAGCAAKKADLPPPAPSQVQPQTPGSAPPVPGQSPANRGGAPGGWPPSGRDVGKPPTDLRSGPMLVHRVRYPGESVSIIAGWYTGEIDNWKVLAEVNPGLNPNVINEGMKINIPESMLKKREPMTREYVDSFYPKSRSKSKGTGSRSPSSTPADEETPLFGPKH